MSRLPVLVLSLAVTACASSPRTANAPRIDGSSEAAFTQSVASLRKTLTHQHSTFVAIALQDIWRTVEAEAAPESSDADKAKAYFARLDGLGYSELIRLADATPPTVRDQYYASLPRPTWHGPLNQDTVGAAAAYQGTDYTGYGLQGNPQFNTSCGSVCR